MTPQLVALSLTFALGVVGGFVLAVSVEVDKDLRTHRAALRRVQEKLDAAPLEPCPHCGKVRGES